MMLPVHLGVMDVEIDATKSREPRVCRKNGAFATTLLSPGQDQGKDSTEGPPAGRTCAISAGEKNRSGSTRSACSALEPLSPERTG